MKKHFKIITGLEDPHKDSFNWKYLRALKNARRLNGVPLIQTYSTAEHSYYVAILFMNMATEHNVSITLQELAFVMQHDAVEAITGDVLLPVKIHNEQTKRNWEEIEDIIVREAHPTLLNLTDEAAEQYFSPQAWKLFKACDLLELFIFCREEIELGNRSDQVKAVCKNCRNLIPEYGFSRITGIVEEE